MTAASKRKAPDYATLMKLWNLSCEVVDSPNSSVAQQREIYQLVKYAPKISADTDIEENAIKPSGNENLSSECRFKGLSDEEKLILTKDIELIVSVGPGSYWSDIYSYSALADAERVAISDLCKYVSSVNQMDPAHAGNGVEIALAGARRLLDLVMIAKKRGFYCPQVPYPSIQYLLNHAYQLTERDGK